MTVEPRHDHYQTDSAVIVSVYLKGCRAEDVQCDIKADSLHLKSVSPSPESSLDVQPLWSTVDTSQSSSKVLGSKIEIKLQKAIVGLQWAQLKGVHGESVSTPAATITPDASSSSNKSAAPRARSKWDSFKPEEEKDENGKPIEERDGGIDDFFKKLYADADDDTRRAMMKSYQESGGTALSTNWNEVGQGKVETKPPEGMEAKKW